MKHESILSRSASILAFLYGLISGGYGLYLAYLAFFGNLSFFIADAFMLGFVVMFLLDGILLFRLHQGINDESVIAADTLFYYFLLTRSVIIGYKLVNHPMTLLFGLYIGLTLISFWLFFRVIFAVSRLHLMHRSTQEPAAGWLAMLLLVVSAIVLVVVLVNVAPQILLDFPILNGS